MCGWKCVFFCNFKGIYSFHFLFQDLYYVHIVGFKVFSLCFTYASSEPAVVGSLSSSGDLLPWLVLIVFLGRHLGVWFGLGVIIGLGADS